MGRGCIPSTSGTEQGGRSAGESIAVVGVITVGFIGGSPAPAKIYRPLIFNDLPGCISDAEITGDLQGSSPRYFKYGVDVVHLWNI